MPGPFPGCDPYLERPEYWRGVHNSLLTFINAALNAILPPGFAASTEERIYLVRPERLLYPDVALIQHPLPEGNTPLTVAGTDVLVEDPPFTLTLMDETIIEPYIEVVALGVEEQVVTVIDVLSPTNKTHDGYGRDSYIRKQELIRQSDVHLLEIDLLRDGLHTVAIPQEALRANEHLRDYLICLHRAGRGLEYECWSISVRSRLPRIRVPLTEGYPDIILDLQACFDRTYDAGPYRRRVNYTDPPVPPLPSADATWANDLLKTQGLR